MDEIYLLTTKLGIVHWWYGEERYTWCGEDFDADNTSLSRGTVEALTCKWCVKRHEGTN